MLFSNKEGCTTARLLARISEMCIMKKQQVKNNTIYCINTNEIPGKLAR